MMLQIPMFQQNSFEVLGGAFPTFSEIDAQGCNATGYVKIDLDQDGISDIIASSKIRTCKTFRKSLYV